MRAAIIFVVLAGVAATLAFAHAHKKPLTSRLDEAVLAELNAATVYLNKLAEAGVPSDDSLECGLCAIATNEVEGFLIENRTEYEIDHFLRNDLCPLLGGLAPTCETMIDGIVVFVLNAIEKKENINTLCVNLSYCPVPFSNHQDPVPAPVFTVDLDLEPDQRWVEICSVPQYQYSAQRFVGGIANLFPRVADIVEDIGTFLNDHYYPTEYAQEISGCSQYLGISAGWLAIINLGYEISDLCTSIIAQALNGTVLHVRNMDFWSGVWLTETLRNMTIQVNYVQGPDHTLVYSATTFAGFVGVLSGQRPNGFSLSIDTRFYPNGIGQLFYEVIAAIEEKNASLVSFLARKTLANEHDYAAAINALSTAELIADVYYIVAGAGVGEGAVITRNRLNATDIWELDANAGRWYEVETNYDHWEQPPWFDDRVAPAEDAMDKIGPKAVTIEAMMGVLEVKPVLNIQTTFSMLACPATGFYRSYVRYCNYPCVE